jgi:hypothetical protein
MITRLKLLFLSNNDIDLLIESAYLTLNDYGYFAMEEQLISKNELNRLETIMKRLKKYYA